MTLRTITVNVGSGDRLAIASKVLGVPDTSVNRLLEAAIRAYNGESRDDIMRVFCRSGGNLEGGGKKYARVDDKLLENIGHRDISHAGRVGIVMLMHPMLTRQEAQVIADDWVKLGRPPKNVSQQAA